MIRAAAALTAAACFLLLPLPPNTRIGHAGAWLREPGEVYAKAAFFRVRGGEEYDASGAARPLDDPALYDDGRYLEAGGAFYAEVGIARDITLVADFLLKAASAEAWGRGGAGDIVGRSLGVPDVRLGARLPLVRGRVVAAFEPSVAIPVAGIGMRNPAAPRLGSGTAAFAATFSAGAGIPALGGYGQVSAGYRARAGKPPDDRFWDAELGAAPAPWLRLRVRYDGVDAVARRAESGAMSLAAETGGQDAHRVAPTLGIALGAGAELSVTWRRTFAGRSTLRGQEWEVAYAVLGLIRPAPPPRARRPD